MSDRPDDPALAAALWDLDPIVGGDAGARAVIDTARERAAAFAARYQSRIADLSAAELVTAMSELAEIQELVAQFFGHAELRAAAHGADPLVGPLFGAADSARSEIAAQLLFVELEWLALDDRVAEALLFDAGSDLDFAAQHLRRLRTRKPFLLDPEAERVLAETGVQRLSAWQRLFTQNVNALTAEWKGETVPLNTVIGVFYSPDRADRQAAVAAMKPALEVGLEVRVAVYNQVLGEKAVDDRLRGCPTWLTARNVANETTEAAVQAQVHAIAARQDLQRRWHRCKAAVLGVDRLTSADLMGPLPSQRRQVPYHQARETLVSSWRRFSESAAETIDHFFTDARIDAPIREHKNGGAFSAEVGTSRHAYILVNYQGQPADTMMLAHELGHGLHHELSRHQGPLQHLTSIPMLEVASTFSELLVSEVLADGASDDRERLEIIGGCLDGAIGNVFTGSGYFRAEAAFHAHRRDSGELTAEDLSEIWEAELTAGWGDTMTMDPGFRLFWSYMGHMVGSPGYLYAYPFGLLTAWSAYGRFREIGADFAEDYLGMLAAGGSRSPAELVEMIGLDLDDPGYWNAGLDQIELLLEEAERLAAAL